MINKKISTLLFFNFIVSKNTIQHILLIVPNTNYITIQNFLILNTLQTYSFKDQSFYTITFPHLLQYQNIIQELIIKLFENTVPRKPISAHNIFSNSMIPT